MGEGSLGIFGLSLGLEEIELIIIIWSSEVFREVYGFRPTRGQSCRCLFYSIV